MLPRFRENGNLRLSQYIAVSMDSFLIFSGVWDLVVFLLSLSVLQRSLYICALKIQNNKLELQNPQKLQLM